MNRRLGWHGTPSRGGDDGDERILRRDESLREISNRALVVWHVPLDCHLHFRTCVFYGLTSTHGAFVRSSVGGSTASASGSASPLSVSSASALSSSNLRYFLLLFFAALAAFLRFTSPTMADRLWSPFWRSSSFCARSSRAILRFWDRDRVAWDLTTMPVGMCLSCTAELVLFCMGCDRQFFVVHP